MTLQKTVKDIIENKLYESKSARGILEFTWGKEDSDKAQEGYNDAVKKLKSYGVVNCDIQPMSQRIIIVLTKDQVDIVKNIMEEYGFQLINTLFDPSKFDGMPSWYNPTLPSNR